MLLTARPGSRVVYMGEAKLEKETQPGGIKLTVTGFSFQFGTVERVEQKDDGFAEADPTVLYHLKDGTIVHADLCRIVGFSSDDFEIIEAALECYAGRKRIDPTSMDLHHAAVADQLREALKDYHYA